MKNLYINRNNFYLNEFETQCIYIIEFQLVIMKNEIVFFEGEWLELDSSILSKLSQFYSNIYYVRGLEMWVFISFLIVVMVDVVKRVGYCYYVYLINYNCLVDLLDIQLGF